MIVNKGYKNDVNTLFVLSLEVMRIRLSRNLIRFKGFIVSDSGPGGAGRRDRRFRFPH